MKMSASKLDMYLTCPAKYQARYLVAEEDKREEEPSSAKDAGTLVHEAIKLATLRRIGKQDMPPVTKKELVELLYAVLREPKKEWKEPPLLNNEVVVRAIGIIDASWKYLSLNKAILAEKPFEIDAGAIGGPEGQELDERIVLNGILDRVDEEDKDRVRIIDYKTGYSLMSHDEAELDPQVNFYLLVGHLMFPGKKIEIELHYLARQIKLGPIAWTAERNDWVMGIIQAACWRIFKWQNFREVPNAYCSNCFRQTECTAFKQAMQGILHPVSRSLADNVAEYARLEIVERNTDNGLKILRPILNRAAENAEDGEIFEGGHKTRNLWVPKRDFNDLKRTAMNAAKVVHESSPSTMPSVAAPADYQELLKAYEAAQARINALENHTKLTDLAFSIACQVGKPDRIRVDKFVNTLTGELGKKVAQVVESTAHMGGYYKLEVEKLPEVFMTLEDPAEEIIASAMDTAAAAAETVAPSVDPPVSTPDTTTVA